MTSKILGSIQNPKRELCARGSDYANVEGRETGNLGSNKSPWIASRDDRAALTRSPTENEVGADLGLLGTLAHTHEKVAEL